MKRKKLAALMALVLCAAWMLSGAFLMLYADHNCPGDCCEICPMLARCRDGFVGILAMGVLVRLAQKSSQPGGNPPQSQAALKWSLVRCKVELLN